MELSLLGGSVRISARSGYLFVWHGRAAHDVAELEIVLQGIEQLKSRDSQTWEKKSWWLSMKSVFGHPFSYKWFSPFHAATFGKNEVYLYTV